MRKLFKPEHLCFFGGDIFATSFYLLWGGEVTHFLFKVIGTIIIGVIGGIAGLAGKDLYPLVKRKFIQFISKLYKNKKSS